MKCILLCAAAIATALPASALPNLPLNRPAVVSGIGAVCTGIGENRQRDPRWATYPLMIVFAGKGGQWVTDGDVTITEKGRTVFAAHCEGSWLLVKLGPGKYRIAGHLDGQRYAEKAYTPRKGQGRVILRFPKTGGAVSREHTAAVRALAENTTRPAHH